MIDRRSAVVLLLGLGVVAYFGGRLLDRFYADPKFLEPHDFLQYWAAGRLNATGGNPYDADQLFELQKAAGRPNDHPVRMWNPPWALTLTMPIGLLDARTAQLVWVGTQFVLVVLAAGWLWRLAGGRADRTWVGWGLAAVAPMTAAVMFAGQSSGWLFVGLVGFYAAVKTDRPRLAGLAALCALKPHLFLPLWLLLVLDATQSRSARARLGWGIAAGLAMVLIPTAVNPHVWGQYLAALREPGGAGHVPLSAWEPPLLGYWLRAYTDVARFGIQFVPTAAVVLLTPVYWWLRRKTWDWSEELPRVLLAGALAAPYGAWDFDLVVLLVPLVLAAERLSHSPRPGVIAAAVAGLALFILVSHQITVGKYYVWMTPAVIAAYVAANRVARFTHTLRGRVGGDVAEPNPPAPFPEREGGEGAVLLSSSPPRFGEGPGEGLVRKPEAAR
jgi:hypothetical protein